MKNKMFSKNGLILLIFITIYFLQFLSASNNYLNITDYDETDIHKILKEKHKLEKNIKNLNQTISNLKSYSNFVENENSKMKLELEKKNKEIANLVNSVKELQEEHQEQKSQNFSIAEIKDVLDQMSEFHVLLNQMQAEDINEKALKTEINEKIRDINFSKRRIDDIYRDLKVIYKDRFDTLMKKISKLQASDENIQKRIYIVEKEREKSSIARGMMKNGIKNVNSVLIEPECINRSSCRICLENPRCVWCAKIKKCTMGDLSGPYDGTCNNEGEFNYSSCEKSSFCSKYNTCTDCIENISCGWCGETNKCLEGGRKTPIGITCSNGYIHKFSQGRCFVHSSLK